MIGISIRASAFFCTLSFGLLGGGPWRSMPDAGPSKKRTNNTSPWQQQLNCHSLHMHQAHDKPHDHKQGQNMSMHPATVRGLRHTALTHSKCITLHQTSAQAEHASRTLPSTDSTDPTMSPTLIGDPSLIRNNDICRHMPMLEVQAGVCIKHIRTSPWHGLAECGPEIPDQPCQL